MATRDTRHVIPLDARGYPQEDHFYLRVPVEETTQRSEGTCSGDTSHAACRCLSGAWERLSAAGWADGGHCPAWPSQRPWPEQWLGLLSCCLL